MKNGFLFSCFFLFLLFEVHAQDDCLCESNLKYLVEHSKANYVGYSYKLNPQTEKRLITFQDSLLSVSRKVKDSYECFKILDSYVLFFHDGHFKVTLNPKKATGVQSIFKDSPRLSLSDQELEIRFASAKKDPVEGLWITGSGSYRIAILKETKARNSFVGIITAADSVFWKKGQIKLKLKKTKPGLYQGTFYNKDHLPRSVKYQLTKSALVSVENSEYILDWQQETAEEYVPASFKNLSSDWNLLTISTFGVVQPIDSVLSLYQERMQSVKNLIIDLRQNSGGGTATFPKLLKLVSDGKINYKGDGILSTQTNIEAYIRSIERLKQFDDVTADEIKSVESTLATLKANPNRLHWYADSTALIPVSTFPQRVYLIFDGSTASAAEMFIQLAQQSTKVITCGTASSGVVDNLDAVTSQMPCPLFQVIYPITRNGFFKATAPTLTSIKMQPALTIPPNTPDWIEYVINKASSEEK